MDSGGEDPIWFDWELGRGFLGGLPEGEVSDSDATYGPDNCVSYDGYLFNRESSLHTVRFRTLDAGWGRWVERDKLETIDGFSQYQYVLGRPIDTVDTAGLYASSSATEDGASTAACTSCTAAEEANKADALRIYSSSTAKEENTFANFRRRSK